MVVRNEFVRSLPLSSGDALLSSTKMATFGSRCFEGARGQTDVLVPGLEQKIVSGRTRKHSVSGVTHLHQETPYHGAKPYSRQVL